MILLRDKVGLQRWSSFSCTEDKRPAMVTHLHYLNEWMASPCGGSTKPCRSAELNGSHDVFSTTAAATSASTGKVLLATPYVTSCSIRPFVKTFLCIWVWLFRVNFIVLLRARTLIKKHKYKFKSSTWSSRCTVTFAWCVCANGWPPLSRERFWPPKPYREGSMTGEELFMLGWSPILAAIWKCNRQRWSLPTRDSRCCPVQTWFLHPQMIQPLQHKHDFLMFWGFFLITKNGKHQIAKTPVEVSSLLQQHKKLAFESPG